MRWVNAVGEYCVCVCVWGGGARAHTHPMDIPFAGFQCVVLYNGLALCLLLFRSLNGAFLLGQIIKGFVQEELVLCLFLCGNLE